VYSSSSEADEGGLVSGRRLGARLTPYYLILPGWLWLAAFFIVPTFVMLSLSTQTGSLEEGFRQTFHIRTYADGWDHYHVQFIRSIEYGLIATGLCLVIGYPVAYWIAFRGGAHKSSLLFLLLLPFFVSFVIRTQSWNFMLADDGIVLSPLKNLGIVSENFHVLTTAKAVILGLTYNFLPFMVLPIFVALERLDPALLEASADLYGSKVATYAKVVLPLSMPGVFAGVLLTFVPASADFVNASILGGAHTTMIGNIIQTQYNDFEYPTASALSFMLMAGLLLGVFAYARAIGTENALEMATAR
jgi:spermidine/putrescine transport system permease protein